MTENSIFRGAATALITPLNENGIDYENFGRVIDWQISEGINALVICDTSGVISVLANVLPRQTAEMCDKYFAGNVKGAARMQLDYLPLINALFCEVNPIPVKAAMAAMGFCENYVRLPLTPMEDAHREKLLALMREQGLDV